MSPNNAHNCPLLMHLARWRLVDRDSPTLTFACKETRFPERTTSPPAILRILKAEPKLLPIYDVVPEKIAPDVKVKKVRSASPAIVYFWTSSCPCPTTTAN